MKYLADIMEERQSKLFKNYKVFFAFNNEQFKQGMEENQIQNNTKMVSMGAGMYCPKNYANKVIHDLDIIYKESIIKDMKQGKEKVILRELQNHECFYTGDPTDCIEKLTDYPITKEEIYNIYRINKFKLN